MSVGSIFSAARTALHAHQTVIETAGHNIANVETEGYTRQRVELTPNFAQMWPYGAVGTGVVVGNVTRARDELLDVSYRKEASGAAAHALRHELLGAVESVLGEPSDDGLAAAMDAFWSSWSDLASDPTSAAARGVVRQRGQNVAVVLNSFDARLRELRDQTAARVKSSLTELNNLSDQVAKLNGRIVEEEVGGKAANDLRDERDRAIDAMSKLGSVRSIPNLDGSVQVLLGNNSVVDGIHARRLRIAEDCDTLAIKFEGSNDPMLPLGGSLSAAVDFLNVDLAETEGRLNALARSLVSRVNASHTQGQLFDQSGAASAAPDFFYRGDVDDPGPPTTYVPVTAGSIRLSDAVLASASKVAASAAAPSAGQVAGPGNNEIALRLAAFRTEPGQVTYMTTGGTTETASFTEFYRDTASRLGTEVKDAESTAQVHQTLADQALRRRMSVSGVNLDEELTTLMRAQQAYAAAARVISTAEEMMRTLVEMV